MNDIGRKSAVWVGMLLAGFLSAPVSASESDSSFQDCYSQCFSVGIGQLTTIGKVRDILESGNEFTFSMRPPFLKSFNDLFFAKAQSAFWRKVRFNTGLYYTHFTGSLYERSYETVGFAPGISLQAPLTANGRHEFLSQFDFRVGMVRAARTGVSKMSSNMQAVFYTGYLYHANRYQIGLLGTYGATVESSPFLSAGAILRLGYSWGAPPAPPAEKAPDKAPEITPEMTPKI